MQLKLLLNNAIASLKAAQTAASSLDARLLLQHAAQITHETIHLQPELEISQEIIDVFNQLIARRIAHEPIAKIIGSKSFWSSDFLVNQYTLDPRPDSEVIIEEAIKLFPDKNGKYNFLDLGTGTGCLLLSLLKEFPKAFGAASDISFEALQVTKQNIKILQLQDRAIILQQNWADSLLEQKFDLIISNPPYIPSNEVLELVPEVKNYDPILALDGGEDGLDSYRYLAKQISTLLKPGAYAILEFGYGQGKIVREIFTQRGYVINKMLFDLSGIERAILVSV